MTDQQPVQAGLDALEVIRHRSFSGRHPELGKMIKCQFCGFRHRENERKCGQVFAKDKDGNSYDLSRFKPTMKSIIGAAAFKGKRRFPPLNKRANEFVQLVRTFVPDEYTKEQLKAARTRARFILAEKYGRHGFLPPLWLAQKRKNEKLVQKQAEQTNS